MIAVSAYRKLFPQTDGVIGYVSTPGNVGDTLIEFATLGLLRKWHIAHEQLTSNQLEKGKLPRHITRLYIAGGGNMGNLYQINREIRNLACSKSRPVTVLPQSFTNTNENLGQYHQIWVRERQSLESCPGARLAPDMAMYLNLDSRSSEARIQTAVFLREDVEGLFAGHPSSYGDPVDLSANLAHYLELIVPYRHIVTDRLHFAIASLLMKRTVTLLPNSYFKNRSMWETWLGRRGCRWADHPDQVDGIRNRRVYKKISATESMQIHRGCQLSRANGWHELSTDSTASSTVENERFGAVEQELEIGHLHSTVWKALRRPRSESQLSSVLQKQQGVNRFNLKQQLNRILRDLFNQGAIEVHPVKSSPLLSIVEPIGGDYGVPIEINISTPVRIGQDIYQFSDIRFDHQLVPIWFRLNRKHAAWLSDAAEAFVLSTVHLAMQFGVPLWVRGAPVDVDLLVNLQQYQRVWSIWHKHLDAVAIHSRIKKPVIQEKVTTRRAIACFSGGVDSTFTLFNHTRNPENRYKLPLTEALLVHGFDVAIEDQASFDRVKAKCHRVAEDAGITLITIATNIRRLPMDWQLAHATVSAAAMHLVSRPYTHGLIPSTLNYGVLFPWGSTPLTDPMLSSSDLKISTDGADYSRVGKIRAMKRWKTGLRYLRFCWVSYPADNNCGRCGKCTVTAIMLLLTKAGKDSIKPFPSHKRLDQQLQAIAFTRLDKSDFRYEIENIKAIDLAPAWVDQLLRKLEANLPFAG